MNAGKLIAQIAALAIIVYCSYSAVISAIPLDKDDLQHPLEGLDTMTVSTTMSGANLNVSINGDVTSNLPQDVVDAKVAFYIGKGDTKLTLAESNIGTISSKGSGTTPITGGGSIPICSILAYSVCALDGEGHLTIPIRAQLEFKYFEWQGSYLIDLGITVNMNYETDISAPTITKDESDHSVTMSIDLGSGETLVSDIVSGLGNGDYSFEFGDATFSAHISGTTVDLKAAGTGAEDAVTIITDYIQSHVEAGTPITFEYNSTNYEIDLDTAESFLEILKILYAKEVTTP